MMQPTEDISKWKRCQENLSDHFHLALQTSAAPLSRTMHYLQNGFSRAFNHRWRRTGPLWQSRYKIKLIENQNLDIKKSRNVNVTPIPPRVELISIQSQ